MSFEVKNIEQENISHGMIGPLTGLVVAFIIASLVFVYYYFNFEKDAIMKEQYLEAESKILKEHKLNESKEYKTLKMDGEEGKIAKTVKAFSDGTIDRSFTPEKQPLEEKKSIEERLSAFDTLEEQLLSEAFAELEERGRRDTKEGRDPIRGVQSFYGPKKMKEIQKIIENKEWPRNSDWPDGEWGKDSRKEWQKWKKENKK